MNSTARRYHCARCHIPVVICRRCDRGNIYCGDACAKPARAASLSRARHKYQSSRPGRFLNAQRQRQFRARRQQKVTHHGSSAAAVNDLLPLVLSLVQNSDKQVIPAANTALHCHFCGEQCSAFLRRDFIRHPRRNRPLRSPLIYPLQEPDLGDR
jgi:hypothetical protein